MSLNKKTALCSQEINNLCEDYISILYHNTQNLYKTERIEEVYGEILYSSVDKLIQVLCPTTKDIFIDFGSGLGKIVLHFFLKSLVQEAYGIEIIPQLHQQAVNAAQRLEQDLPEFYVDKRRISFLLGDFLKAPLPKATIALLVSTCFTQSTLNALGVVLENTPSIHTVLSLRPIHTLNRIPFKKTLTVECSWDSDQCYIYSTNVIGHGVW